MSTARIMTDDRRPVSPCCRAAILAAAEGPRPALRSLESEGGFTLVEMLVSTALLSLIAGLLFFSLDQVSRATSGGLGKATQYQDLRTAVDQISRELQQAIPYVAVDSFGSTNSIFLGKCTWPNVGNSDGDAEMHFVATIDNNTGYEEVEVHYRYDGTNALWKCLTYYGGTNSSSGWDFQTDGQFNTGVGITMGKWARTPTFDNSMNDYAPILYGVKAAHFEFSSSTNSGSFNETWLAQRQAIPGYIRITLSTYDSAVLRRWGSANFVPNTQTNLLRTIQFFVQLPRANE